MFKLSALFIGATLVASLLLVGCSQSNGYSNSVPNTEGDEVSGLASADGEVSELNSTGDKVINEPTLPEELNASINDDTNLSELNTTSVEVINGHILPPEPDPKINNATLLGIDFNNNGVRDDVEIWIYKTYKDKHPVYIDIAMQAARAYKLVLEHPEKAREIRKIVNAPMNCGIYYQYNAKYLNEPTLVDERIDAKVFNKYFQTEERRNTYWQYDKLLSGGVYDALRSAELKTQCDFDTNQYEE